MDLQILGTTGEHFGNERFHEENTLGSDQNQNNPNHFTRIPPRTWLTLQNKNSFLYLHAYALLRQNLPANENILTVNLSGKQGDEVEVTLDDDANIHVKGPQDTVMRFLALASEHLKQETDDYYNPPSDDETIHDDVEVVLGVVTDNTTQNIVHSNQQIRHMIPLNKDTILNGIKEANDTTRELENAALLFTAESGSDASKLIMDAGNFNDSRQATEAIRKNTALNTRVLDVVSHATGQVSNVLHNRINTITTHSTYLGLAAGDEKFANQKEYGVWIMPLYNQGVQKGQGRSYGYKENSSGKIIGADIGLNDHKSTMGFAFSFVNGNAKYNNNYQDKTKADSTIFSLYGKQTLTDNWFTQWIASYSSTKIDHTEERIFSFGNQMARANYKSSAYSGEVLLGYDVKFNRLVLTPLAGISYMESRDGAYKETGLPFANRAFFAHNRHRVDAIAGGRLSGFINTGNSVIILEIHGILSTPIKGKAGKMVVKIDGINSTFTDIPAKIGITGNIGVSITAKSGVLEYGLGYDMQLAKKHIGHQGNLKLRVNF